jgi:glycosyltransferase involved in cell wall biosynthesis
MQPSIAIITTVYNEDVLLPIWLRYYGAHLGREHLYVIDDGSNDGSTTGLDGVNVIRLERAPIDQDSRAFTVSLFHREMLKHYDVVIFTDVDEFLVVDPLAKLGLADYIARHTGAHTNALGFDIVHNQFDEPTYAPELGVFQQRRYLEFSRPYCKQLIHRQEVMWMPGFHYTNHSINVGVGIYLFHLRALDYELSRKRINNRNKLPWSERSLAKGQGAQNRLGEVEYLRAYFLDSPEDFELAAPETHFNKVAARAAQIIADNTPLDSTIYADLHNQLLSLPARFRNTLPAVMDKGVVDADRGPARVSSADAQQMYLGARDTVISTGMGFKEQ